MPPQPRLAIVATIQQAITELLTTYEPEFLRFGYSLFLAFATILIAWHGIRMMLSHDGLGDHLFGFAKLLLFISFGYALIAFYEAPIPGIGVSFSNLITDQTHHFATVLDARSLELMFDHLDELWDHFVQPDAWSILANLLYWLMLIVVTLAKVISLAIVAFGLIASAVCALLGPIFVPFFIVPKLDWLFWSWLKAFIQYLVHPGGFVRFSDDFRAVRVQLFDDAPAGDHRGPVPRIRAAVPCRDRHVRRRHLARPLADEFDLLWPGRSEHPPGPDTSKLRRSPCVSSRLNAKWRDSIGVYSDGLPDPLRRRRAHRPGDWCRVGHRRPPELPRPAIGGCRGRSRRGRQPKTIENAKRQFVELYGSSLVLNTYLKIALVLVSLLALGLLFLNFRTQAQYANLKPLVIRIDEVGRAEAVAYDATQLQAASAGAALLPDAVRDDAFQPAACHRATGLSGLAVLPGTRPSPTRRSRSTTARASLKRS